MSTPSPLDNIKIAAPCTANWNEMSGDERSRQCALCKKNVYNLSSMSRAEAEALIAKNEGNKFCVRLFQRADGTVIVDNCPVGLRVIRNRMRWIGTGIAAALTLLGGAAVAAMNTGGDAASGERMKAWLFP